MINLRFIRYCLGKSLCLCVNVYQGVLFCVIFRKSVSHFVFEFLHVTVTYQTYLMNLLNQFLGHKRLKFTFSGAKITLCWYIQQTFTHDTNNFTYIFYGLSVPLKCFFYLNRQVEHKSLIYYIKLLYIHFFFSIFLGFCYITTMNVNGMNVVVSPSVVP